MYKYPIPFCDITPMRSSFKFNVINYTTVELRCPDYLNSPDYNIKVK